MRKAFIPVLLLTAFASCGQVENSYLPITGELLEHWNTANPSCFPTVSNFDIEDLPDSISELRIAGIEVEDDSLDIYLLGIAEGNDIPLLLAAGGYRGEINFAKSFAFYQEEEDEIQLAFQMPFSARYAESSYRWNRSDQTLQLLRHITGDPSADALARADSLLLEGEVEEAIDELNNMFYPQNYYSTDEMIPRILRSVNQVALEEHQKGNHQKAVAAFRSISEFSLVSSEWYTAFDDSLDFMESDFSTYMDLDEYVMIMNNYGFFLEQVKDLDISLAVLRTVLELDQFRMVAHLNIADVLWDLGEQEEAEEYYRIYLWMMTDQGLSDQIPPRAWARTNMSVITSAGSDIMEIHSEHLVPIEGIMWNPVRINSCQVLESGEMSISASRLAETNGVSINDETWLIKSDSEGNLISCEETAPDNQLILTTSQLGGSREMWLIACTEQADTVWKCVQEGTDDFFNSPDVIESRDGDYLVSNRPDCFAPCILIENISSTGEMMCRYWLTSDYLLDLPEVDGETSPQVTSLRKTSGGNILVSGSVRLWLTDPYSWFVCLLDGDTGDPLWKTTGTGLGMTRIYDAVETSSGSIIAVGVTAVSIRPPGAHHRVWGSGMPFMAVLDDSGELQDIAIFDLDITDWFCSILEIDAAENSYLLAGSYTESNDMVLLMVTIPGD